MASHVKPQRFLDRDHLWWILLTATTKENEKKNPAFNKLLKNFSPCKGNWTSCPPICCVHLWRIWKTLFFPVLIQSNLYWSELLQTFGLQGCLSPKIGSASRIDQHCYLNPVVELNMSPLLLKNCWNRRKWKSHKSIFLFVCFSRPRRIKL